MELKAGKVDTGRDREEGEGKAAELLVRVRVELEGRIRELEEEMRTEEGKWRAELAAIVSSQKAASEENAKLRDRLEERENLLLANSQENTKLVRETQQKHMEISDLQFKLSQLNLHIDQLQQDLIEAKQGSNLGMEQLEKALADSDASNSSLQSQLRLANDSLSSLQTTNRNLEQVAAQERLRIAQIQDTLQSQISKVSELEEKLRHKEVEFAQQLQDVKTSLETSVESLKQVWENLKIRELEEQESRVCRAEEAIRTLTATLRVKEEEKTGQDRKISEAIASQTRLNSRIKELESALGAQKERWEQQSKRDEEVISGLRKEVGTGRDRMQQLMTDLSTKEAALSKLQAQSVGLLGKIEEAKAKIDQYSQKMAKSEGRMRDLESKCANLELERGEMERQSIGKEQRLKQLTGKIKALEDDIWNKDSESLKKDGLIIKYSGQIDDMKKALQQAHAKLRAAAADQLAEMSAALERKEGEIALLKEMLRSAKIQAKGTRKKTAEPTARPTETEEARPS